MSPAPTAGVPQPWTPLWLLSPPHWGMSSPGLCSGLFSAQSRGCRRLSLLLPVHTCCVQVPLLTVMAEPVC